MPYYFHSRRPEYRSPFGAVAEGTSVFFRICLPREWGCYGSRLVMQEDGGTEQRMDMFWAGMEGDAHEWWDCHFTPERPGLYWYAFALALRDGTGYLVRCDDGSADLSRESGRCWQLTCYAADFVTPDWLAGGVMYQIFPDRFAASGRPKAGVPADRKLHAHWGEQPEWRPDATTHKVRNNDYFGGDLPGIEERLDRLAYLGVTCLYLNPIFEAHSNHRYDTADYTAIDPLLGTEADLESLARTAGQLGIRLLLDGVFSHTGADSRYFNKEGRYPEPGAYQSLSSAYASWYQFDNWPREYTGWWGFPTLPEVDELSPAFLRYITGPDGVARRWLRKGASGWRLDVADELPDGFLDVLRRAVKEEKPDALILGEVWEDASNKQSYGHRRRYLQGQQLDSVMNYPFRDAILRFLTGGSSTAFFNKVEDIVENYPPQVLRLLMNPLGTHDTERVLTALAGEPAGGRGREWQAAQALSEEQRAHGLRLLKLASALQYCLPGVPCIYYGDEAGMEGYNDPFNRGCYPWGAENAELLRWYHRLGQVRRVCPALREGAFVPLAAADGTVAFERRDGDSRLLCAVNRCAEERSISLPPEWRGRTMQIGEGWLEEVTLHLPPYSCALGIWNAGEE